MPEKQTQRPEEETLDPSDWDGMRRLGHQMMDDMMDYLQNVRERDVWEPLPESAKMAMDQPLPMQGEAVEKVYAEFKRDILPHPLGNIHPRFWGWVIGTGTPFGVLAEMLAATMNVNQGGADHIANYVEAQVLDWFKDIFSFPKQASGLLVSGGSMANLVALTVARNAKAGFDIRKQGVHASNQLLTMYTSTETHSSVKKAVDLLGLGHDALRLIPVNDTYEVQVEIMEQTIKDDLAAGHRPVCVIATAGTVNTGATDNLPALAHLCKRYDLWYHVDGAFGALTAVAPELAQTVSGIEKADSIAFDLHKWMYMPIEVGCTLVRHKQSHRDSFALSAEYLEKGKDRGLASGPHWFSDYGVQLSRGFRALKVWLCIKEHGMAKYGRMIKQNVEQTAYLASLVEQSTELELLAPAPLNIVCFRYRGKETNEDNLNTLNRELLIQLYESGVAAPSYTVLKGRYAIRVANVNQRSRREDFDILVTKVTQLGRQLSA